MASEALRLVKRGNTRLSDLAVDAGLTHARIGAYNINTGLGGGGA